MHDELIIKAETELQIADYNPFDFIIYPLNHAEIPFEYSQSLNNLFSPSLSSIHISSALLDYGKEVFSEAGHKTMDFLTRLTQKTHKDFKVEYRQEGPPHDPSHTFEIKRGSCRDLAWMQIHLLRNMGLAARFVSGYFYIEGDEVEYELHAWTETYIPGAGWIGFDPSHGMVSSSSHIPIASSSHFENTMPVTGSIRGESSSQLSSTLQIEVV